MQDNSPPDGVYDLHLGKINKVVKDDFKNEKELCDYLEANLKIFCLNVLKDPYLSHEREYSVFKIKKNVCKRIDFLIRCEKRTYVVECKKPRDAGEFSKGIGQLLTYNVMLLQAGLKADRCILITTKYDQFMPIVIAKYALPIDVILFSKKITLYLK